MRSLFGIFLITFVLGYGSGAVAGGYADAVTQWYPGGMDVSSLDLASNSPCTLTTRALNLNDVLGAPDGKFVSLGWNGTIVVRIPDVVDMPGPDIAVWMSCAAACNYAEFRVSFNGATFQLAGVMIGAVTYKEMNVDFYPEMEPVRYVMISSGESCTNGIDVDAVANLQTALAVEPTTWGAIKALYR